MYNAVVQITNKLGLHARPASDFAMEAKKFSSSIVIRNLDSKNPVDINAKMPLKILAGRIKMGDSLEIKAKGEDEKKAVEALLALIASGFGE